MGNLLAFHIMVDRQSGTGHRLMLQGKFNSCIFDHTIVQPIPSFMKSPVLESERPTKSEKGEGPHITDSFLSAHFYENLFK